MYNRRKFLQTTGAAALGTFAVSKAGAAFFEKKMHPIGLQLFTFFNEIDNDVEGTLKK